MAITQYRHPHHGHPHPRATIERHWAAVGKVLTYRRAPGITVKDIRRRRGHATPVIEVLGNSTAPALTWSLSVWGHDRQGYYRRYVCNHGDCLLIKEERYG